MILALRYLGKSSRKAAPVDEVQARHELGEAGQFLGRQLAGGGQAQALAPSMKDLVLEAERLKKIKKGL